MPGHMLMNRDMRQTVEGTIHGRKHPVTKRQKLVWNRVRIRRSYAAPRAQAMARTTPPSTRMAEPVVADAASLHR